MPARQTVTAAVKPGIAYHLAVTAARSVWQTQPESGYPLSRIGKLATAALWQELQS